MFSMVLRRVRLSVIYMGQWNRKYAIDSVSKPQLQIASPIKLKTFYVSIYNQLLGVKENVGNIKILAELGRTPLKINIEI